MCGFPPMEYHRNMRRTCKLHTETHRKAMGSCCEERVIIFCTMSVLGNQNTNSYAGYVREGQCTQRRLNFRWASCCMAACHDHWILYPSFWVFYVWNSFEHFWLSLSLGSVFLGLIRQFPFVFSFCSSSLALYLYIYSNWCLCYLGLICTSLWEVTVQQHEISQNNNKWPSSSFKSP